MNCAGEHRATFRSLGRYKRRGYDIVAPDGEHINQYRSKYHFGQDFTTKADFEPLIRQLLKLGRIPTRDEIERSLLINQAAKDNQEHDRQVQARRDDMRKHILQTALALYIESNPAAEYDARAREMLDTLQRGWVL